MFSAYAAVFAAMALWELLAPRRELTAGRGMRWTPNLALGLLNQALVRVLFPGLLVGFASVVQVRSWGVLNLINIPYALAVLVGFLLLDLTIYTQHRVFHKVPLLWRLHRVHHSDVDFDFTTALRFHPLEIVLSMLIKMAAVSVVGPPAIAVIMFELALSLNALFNHGNVRLAPAIDRRLRWLLVTPDFHRVHHSTRVEETNSNYAFNLSFWDRLFRTYRAQPAAGHREMRIGQEEFRDAKKLGLGNLLGQPFRPAR